MADFIFIGLTLLFFVITFGFIKMCEQLIEDKS